MVQTESQLYRDLLEIADRDPDGGEIEPTDNMYTRHREWAIAAYGMETWRMYSDTYWRAVSDV